MRIGRLLLASAAGVVLFQAATHVDYSHFGQGDPAAPQYSQGGGQASCPETTAAAAVRRTSIGAGIQLTPVCLGDVRPGRHWFTVTVSDTGTGPETLRLAGADDVDQRVPRAWFGTVTVHAGPGQTRPVRDWITIPANAKSGQHRGLLEVSAAASGDRENNGAGADTYVIFTVTEGR